MCLSWDDEPVMSGEELRAYQMRLKAESGIKDHDAVCDNILMSVMGLRDRSRVVTFFLPVQSPSATMFMYPCAPKFIGSRNDKTRGLLEQADRRAKIPCYKKDVTDYFCPEKYVTPHQRNRWRSLGDEPMYRSLGADNVAQASKPLERGKVCENADGSFTCQLTTSAILESQDVVDNMDIDTKVQYLNTVREKCLDALLYELKDLKLDVDKILPMGDDGKVTFETAEKFMALLYPVLQGGCDILVAIPPLDDEGRPSAKNEAAFTFGFHLDADQDDLPILGLAHNLEPNMAVEEIKLDELKHIKQEYNYWIVSNVHPETAYAHIDDPNAPPNTTESRFRVKFPTRQALVFERFDHAEYDSEDYKLEQYAKDCYDFQNKCQERIFELWVPYLRYQQVGSHLKMPDGDEQIAVSNLKGSHLSPLTSTIHFPNRPVSTNEKPAVPEEEMHAAIAAAKEGVMDAHDNVGWWAWATENKRPEGVVDFPDEEVDDVPYEEVDDFPDEDDDGIRATKRFRKHAEVAKRFRGITLDPALGSVTATALRKEIRRRVGPFTRSRDT